MKSKRGFASMSKSLRTSIARRGGKSAHEKGVAYKWNTDTAREAGRLGGLKRLIKKL